MVGARIVVVLLDVASRTCSNSMYSVVPIQLNLPTKVTLSHELLHMDIPVLADQQRLSSVRTLDAF